MVFCCFRSQSDCRSCSTGMGSCNCGIMNINVDVGEFWHLVNIKMPLRSCARVIDQDVSIGADSCTAIKHRTQQTLETDRQRQRQCDHRSCTAFQLVCEYPAAWRQNAFQQPGQLLRERIRLKKLRTIREPSFARMPTAAPAWLIASMAYSIW